MSLPVPTAADLARARTDETIVRQTIGQVQKDFGMFGIEIQLPEDITNAYDNLLYQVKRRVDELMRADSGRLQSLLYQVDISEKNMRLANSANTAETQITILAELILDRELKKVLYRHFFKP